MELTREIRDRRVAVMADVLLQLGRADVPLNIGHGYSWLSGSLDEPIPIGSDIQEYVDTIQESCGVCQLGAMFLSKARLYDGVTAIALDWWAGEEDEVEEIYCVDADRIAIEASLSGIFDAETLRRIEAAFECWKGLHETEGRFGRRYDDPRERARAIAQNVIGNDGEFIVPETPEASCPP